MHVLGEQLIATFVIGNLLYSIHNNVLLSYFLGIVFEYCFCFLTNSSYDFANTTIILIGSIVTTKICLWLMPVCILADKKSARYLINRLLFTIVVLCVCRLPFIIETKHYPFSFVLLLSEICVLGLLLCVYISTPEDNSTWTTQAECTAAFIHHVALIIIYYRTGLLIHMYSYHGFLSSCSITIGIYIGVYLIKKCFYKV